MSSCEVSEITHKNWLKKIFKIAFVYLILQARHDINNDDLPAARRHWRTACQWPYLGACVWVSVILPIVISGLIIGIVLVIVL